MSEKIGDGPVQREYRVVMEAIARTIDEFLNGKNRPKQNGFCLLVFRMGEKGRCNYMSNAARPDVIRMLEGQVARFKLDDPLPKLVADSIGSNGALNYAEPLIFWHPGEPTIKLEGEFTAEELHALAWHLEKQTK